MSVDSAKELVTRLALDEDFRSQVETASDADKQRRIISEAGYGNVTANDVLRVQSDLEQKGLFSDLGGYLGKAVVDLGFDPANVGAQNAGNIGKAVGSAVDLLSKFIFV